MRTKSMLQKAFEDQPNSKQQNRQKGAQEDKKLVILKNRQKVKTYMNTH